MTDRYALIGNPVSHSKSPLIHTEFAQATGQDLEYTTIESTADDLAARIHAFRAAGGKGMNVTAPFKVLAMALATDRLERAALSGATNTLKFEGDRILADNVDGVGLVADIQRNLRVPLAGRRVLLLGAGGAVRGALLPFLQQRPAELVVANRTPARAVELAQATRGHARIAGCGYADLANERFDIVVNGTSASLRGELPAVPSGVFAASALAYDLVYGKGLTPFMRMAQDAGARRIADGVGMLVEQAAEAFHWWRGVRPDTSTMIARMTAPA